MGNLVRLAGIAYESLVNGPGMRRVFFAQGCRHNCIECFNPDTHSFSGGELMDMDKLIKDVKVNPMIKGITFSGGDPLEQPKEFSYLARGFKELGLNIWCYTGYEFEEIMKKIENNTYLKELIFNIDVLVDGKFKVDKKMEGLIFRGSSNQRIIDVKNSLKLNEIILLDY